MSSNIFKYLQSSRLVIYFLVRMVTEPSTMMTGTSLQDQPGKWKVHLAHQISLWRALLISKATLKETRPALVEELDMCGAGSQSRTRRCAHSSVSVSAMTSATIVFIWHVYKKRKSINREGSITIQKLRHCWQTQKRLFLKESLFNNFSNQFHSQS